MYIHVGRKYIDKDWLGIELRQSKGHCYLTIKDFQMFCYCHSLLSAIMQHPPVRVIISVTTTRYDVKVSRLHRIAPHGLVTFETCNLDTRSIVLLYSGICLQGTPQYPRKCSYTTGVPSSQVP